MAQQVKAFLSFVKDKKKHKPTDYISVLRHSAIVFQHHHHLPQTQSASTVWCPGPITTERPATPALT